MRRDSHRQWHLPVWPRCGAWLSLLAYIERPLDPIKALFYSAVINGFVAVPIMAAMMLMVSRHSAMGKFTARPRLLFFGWAATAVMALAAVAMLVAR